MYTKNLTEDLRLRLTTRDMDFLRSLSDERGQSVSEVIRNIIGEYRRGLDSMATLSKAIELVNLVKEGEMSHGDTKTNFDNKL